jgi:Tfp pilus assembly PilM family ATPase
MLAQKFFNLFPTPKFLDIPHAGLDISDDAVRCIEYSRGTHGHFIHHFASKDLAPGIIENGEIKNKEALIEALMTLSQEAKIHVVKVSLPEEKMYLFKTQVPSVSKKDIRQNVEFKLEENVPLTVEETVFFFDLIPNSTGVVMEGGEVGNIVGVSVAPRSLVLSYLEVIEAAGISVFAFEIQAKALARMLVPKGSSGTDIIVHIMNNKTGIYVVCGGVVCFTSTVPWGNTMMASTKDHKANFNDLKKHLQDIDMYWKEHGLGTPISRVVFVGKGALTDGLISECSTVFSGKREPKVRLEIGKVWQNIFSHNSYIPPISYEESLEYAVSAGLALPEEEY